VRGFIPKEQPIFERFRPNGLNSRVGEFFNQLKPSVKCRHLVNRIRCIRRGRQGKTMYGIGMVKFLDKVLVIR